MIAAWKQVATYGTCMITAWSLNPPVIMHDMEALTSTSAVIMHVA
jgi:hypothetical protein